MKRLYTGGRTKRSDVKVRGMLKLCSGFGETFGRRVKVLNHKALNATLPKIATTGSDLRKATSHFKIHMYKSKGLIPKIGFANRNKICLMRVRSLGTAVLRSSKLPDDAFSRAIALVTHAAYFLVAFQHAINQISQGTPKVFAASKIMLVDE